MRMSRLVQLMLMSLAGASLLIAACGPAQPPKRPAPKPTPVTMERSRPKPRPMSVWEQLKSKDPKVRKAAVETLADKDSPKALKAVAGALADKHPTVQRAASLALAKKGAAAIPALITQIRSHKLSVRRKILALLASRWEPKATAGVIKLLTDADPEIRAEAAYALTRMTDVQKQAQLLKALATSKHNAVIGMVWALRGSGDPKIRAALMQRLAASKGTYERHNMLTLLVSGDEAWYGIIAAALSGKSVDEQRGALRALGYELESLGRIQHSAAAMGEKTLATWAAAEIGRWTKALTAAKALPILTKLAKSKDPDFALAAVNVIRGMGRKFNARRAEKAYLKQLKKLAKDAKVGVDVRIRVNTLIGVSHWRKSCKVKPVYGLCTKVSFIQRKGETLKRRVLTHVKRKAREVKKAQAAFDTALKLWDGGRTFVKLQLKGPDKYARIARARHYAAWATFMRAELGLGDYLRDSMPKGLKLDPEKAAVYKAEMARLKAWLTRKNKTAKALLGRYRDVVTKVQLTIKGIRRGSKNWSLASQARAGLVYQNYAQELSAAEVPKSLRNKPLAVDEYLAHMERFAGPLRKKAALRYQICLKLSARINWYWELALNCQTGLAATEPFAFARWQHQSKAYLTRLVPVTAGVLSAEVPRIVVATAKMALTTCLKRQEVPNARRSVPVPRIVKHPVAKQAFFSLDVAANGKVMRVKITADGRLPANAQACTVKVLKGLQFPPHPGPTLTVKVPYQLTK